MPPVSLHASARQHVSTVLYCTTLYCTLLWIAPPFRDISICWYPPLAGLVPRFVASMEFSMNSAVPWNTAFVLRSSFSAPPFFSCFGRHTRGHSTIRENKNNGYHRAVLVHALGSCFLALLLHRKYRIAIPSHSHSIMSSLCPPNPKGWVGFGLRYDTT